MRRCWGFCKAPKMVRMIAREPTLDRLATAKTLLLTPFGLR